MWKFWKILKKFGNPKRLQSRSIICISTIILNLLERGKNFCNAYTRVSNCVAAKPFILLIAVFRCALMAVLLFAIASIYLFINRGQKKYLVWMFYTKNSIIFKRVHILRLAPKVLNNFVKHTVIPTVICIRIGNHKLDVVSFHFSPKKQIEIMSSINWFLCHK